MVSVSTAMCEHSLRAGEPVNIYVNTYTHTEYAVFARTMLHVSVRVCVNGGVGRERECVEDAARVAAALRASVVGLCDDMGVREVSMSSAPSVYTSSRTPSMLEVEPALAHVGAAGRCCVTQSLEIRCMGLTDECQSMGRCASLCVSGHTRTGSAVWTRALTFGSAPELVQKLPITAAGDPDSFHGDGGECVIECESSWRVVSYSSPTDMSLRAPLRGSTQVRNIHTERLRVIDDACVSVCAFVDVHESEPGVVSLAVDDGLYADDAVVHFVRPVGSHGVSGSLSESDSDVGQLAAGLIDALHVSDVPDDLPDLVWGSDGDSTPEFRGVLDERDTGLAQGLAREWNSSLADGPARYLVDGPDRFSFDFRLATGELVRGPPGGQGFERLHAGGSSGDAVPGGGILLDSGSSASYVTHAAGEALRNELRHGIFGRH